MGCSSCVGFSYPVSASAYAPQYSSPSVSYRVPVRSESNFPSPPELTPIAALATADKPVIVYYNN